MLTPDDDHLLHQQLAPSHELWTDDPRAYERYWFTAHDRVGRLRVTQGCGFYPNLGTSEAFSIVVLDGRHTTVRCFRRFTGTRHDLQFGPIGAEIVHGLASWRLSLGQNDYGIAYELTWHDTKQPQFHRVEPMYHDGRLVKEMAGFETFGSCHGWVEVGDERFEVDASAFSGSRDRHWGVRNGVGGPAFVVDPGPAGSFPAYYPGQWVEFPDFAIWGDQVLRNHDDPRPPGKIVRFRRRLAFEPETKLFVAGVIDNELDNGRTIQLEFERLGNQIAFLRCGAYGGPRGGTPDKDIWAGMSVGGFVVEGETYDVNDPEVRARIAGLDQYHCRVRYGDVVVPGLLELYEPATYERCARGEETFELR